MKRDRTRERARVKAIRKERARLGLCRCGKAPVEGRTLCQPCADGNRRRNDTQYRRVRAKGLCGRCHKRPAVLGITRCEECSAAHSAEISGHGASLDLRRQLFFGQGGRCAICSRDMKEAVGANVDHCHKTGLIRGLLCARCNKAIGWFGDDPALLEAAALYLRQRTTKREVA